MRLFSFEIHGQADDDTITIEQHEGADHAWLRVMTDERRDRIQVQVPMDRDALLRVAEIATRAAEAMSPPVGKVDAPAEAGRGAGQAPEER